MKAFVYCSTDNKTNKLYVGSHKGSIDDSYVCSSRHMMKEYRERPEDFTRQIIAEGSVEDVRKLETKILLSVNAKLNEDFYNLWNADGKFFLEKHKEETKQKISNSKKGYKHSVETKKKLSELKKFTEPWNKNKKGLQASTRKGVSRTAEEKLKMSENRKGIQAWNKNIDSSEATFYGKKHSEESKKKMSESRKLYWQKKQRIKEVLI